MAASALLFALPMCWVLLAFPKIGPEAPPSPEEPSARTPMAAPGGEGPRVTITLASSMTAYSSSPARDMPAVLPSGFLIPEDGSRERNHEGD